MNRVQPLNYGAAAAPINAQPARPSVTLPGAHTELSLVLLPVPPRRSGQRERCPAGAAVGPASVPGAHRGGPGGGAGVVGAPSAAATAVLGHLDTWPVR